MDKMIKDMKPIREGNKLYFINKNLAGYLVSNMTFIYPGTIVFNK
jgi:hypothetical protein